MSKRNDIDCRNCIYRVKDSRITTKGKPYMQDGKTNKFYCLVVGKFRLFKKRDCFVFEAGEPLINRIKKLEESKNG